MTDVKELQRWLGETLHHQMRVHEVPGVSVALLVDGQVVESVAGVVNLRTGVEVTPDAVFMIQSTTKVWTATLVMQLVDEGLVELDMPVRRYLPEFRTADDQVSDLITVRHLLTHTGGFEGDLWAPTTCGDDALQRFVEDLVPQAAQRTPPGELYSYCNAGIGVLGRLIEVLRGTTYETALRQHLAGPLGLEEVAFNADQALGYRTAIGHARPTPDSAQQPLKVWAIVPPSNPAAGNQLAMSARALLGFGRMHLSEGVAPDGAQVLSPVATRLMRQPQVSHPAAAAAAWSHGLGWFVRDEGRVVEHGGGAIGVASLLRIVPARDVAVAILTNGGNGQGLIDAVVDPLLRELAGLEPAPPVPTPAASARIAEPGRYLGHYQTRVMDSAVTQDDSGRLWLEQTSRNELSTMARTAGVTDPPQRHELRPINATTFARVDPSGRAGGAVEFLGADDNGRFRFLHFGRIASRRK